MNFTCNEKMYAYAHSFCYNNKKLKGSAIKLKKSYLEFSRMSEGLRPFALLLIRMVIAYGFYTPAMHKWNDIGGVTQWFASMGIPFPMFSAYMAAASETVGVVLLALGLFTRLISIPLIFIMMVAIFMSNLSHGFAAGNNGFDVPQYYILFLLIFLSHGAGKFSLDRLIFGEKN